MKKQSQIPEAVFPVVSNVGPDDAGAARNLFHRLGNYAQALYRTATGSYFIQGSVASQQNDKEIMKCWLKYNAATGANDFVTDPTQATCFDIILASSVKKDLQKLFADMKSLSFSIVPAEEILLAQSLTAQTIPADRLEGFMNLVEHAHRDFAQVKITAKGIEYFKENYAKGKEAPDSDILFLLAIVDGGWHNLVEIKKREIPDIEAIIIQAKENELIIVD